MIVVISATLRHLFNGYRSLYSLVFFWGVCFAIDVFMIPLSGYSCVAT